MFLITVPQAIARGIGRVVKSVLIAALYIPKIIGWVMVSVVSFSVATPTTIRCFSSKDKMSATELTGRVIAGGAMYLTLFFSILDLLGASSSPTPISLSTYIPHFGYVLMAMLAANLLSLFYEIGRKKTGEVEKPTAEAKAKPDDGVSDFMTMYDSIRGFDSLAPEQTRELYRRIVELTGERKITPDEAQKLCAIVENAARNSSRQRQGTGEYARE